MRQPTNGVRRRDSGPPIREVCLILLKTALLDEFPLQKELAIQRPYCLPMKKVRELRRLLQRHTSMTAEIFFEIAIEKAIHGAEVPHDQQYRSESRPRPRARQSCFACQ